MPHCKRLDDGTTAYGYKWQKARKAFLKRYPLCVECMGLGRTEEATVIDHDPPHRGNAEKFWDEDTWFPLCETHLELRGRHASSMD